MVVKFDSLSRMERLVLTLCNPGCVYNDGRLSNVISILPDHESEEIVFNFNSSSELSFRVYKTSSDDDESNTFLKNTFEAIKNKRLIFVEHIGFFVIDDVKSNSDGDSTYKDITAKSVDIEIQQRNIPYIEDGTYRFSTQGNNKGILQTIVETLPLWTIGYVDSTVSSKYRTFEDVDISLNCLSFLINNVQEAYECIIIFDIINRTINVYDQANYIHNTDVHITKDDLITSCTVTEQSDDLYTAITVLGNDDVVISPINPLGTNTIYDFTYYLSWMTPSLSTKVLNWQQAIQSNLTTYYNKQLSLYTKMDQKAEINFEIEKLETQLEMYERCLKNIGTPDGKSYVADYNTVIVNNGGTPITITPQIDEMKAQIRSLISQCNTAKTNKVAQRTSIDHQIATLTNQITDIQDSLSFENNFTNTELEELQNYIFEGSYKDEYVVITDIMTNSEKFNQMKTLFDRAKLQLNRVSSPTSEYELDIESFIFTKEFQHASEQLETGCLINVELEEGDVAELFLSNFKVNYDDHSFSMTFGNRYNKFDPKTLFNKVLGSVSKSSNTLSYIKDLLYPLKNNDIEKLYTLFRDSRNVTMGNALASDNEEVIIDSSGYTGRTKNPQQTDGFDPEQIKITGKNIVFTDDRWESCKTAIGKIQLSNDPTDTVYGINAEVIIGNLIMGNELQILDNQGREIFTVVDGKIHSQIQDNNEKYVDGRIADSAASVKTYADSQISQTADSITSEVKGRFSATVGHSSKNLFEITTSTITQNGLTFTVDKSAGTITVNGTSTATTIVGVGTIKSIGNYLLSGGANGGSSEKYYLYAYDGTEAAICKKWDGVTDSQRLYDTSTTEVKLISGHNNAVRILIRSDQTLNNVVFKPMIRNRVFENDDSFEPYYAPIQNQVNDVNSRITQTADSITSEVNKKVNTTDLQANYSTTEQMNSKISQTAGEIAMSVTKSTLGYSGKNLLKITGTTTTVNGITFTVNKSAGTITATGTATANASFAVARGTDLPTGDLYLSGGGSSGSTATYYVYAYDYTVDARPKKWDGTTQSESSINTESNVEVKLVSGHDTAIRIMVREGVTVNGKVFKPMLRYGSIVDSTFEPWVDNGAKICSQISMTDEQISLTSGRLLITSGNFKLNSSGTATMTNAVLTGGSITSGNYQSNTSGMKIQLSDGTIDSKNFKVSSTGVVTATSATLNSCSIAGGTIQSTNYDTDEGTGMKIALSSGAISTGSGKFSVSSSGTATMTNAVLTGGTIKTSNYAAASGSTKTVGGEINLNATGSTLMFDTAGFKVAGNGVCTIGGSSVIQSDNYVSGTSGMKITLSNGKIDSKNFKIDENGSMTSTSGSIGRWTISSDKISQTAGGYTVNLSNYNTTSSASHFIACIDGDNNTTFAIERSGMLKAYSSEIRIGEDAFQQLRCQAGHIDFYYNNIKSGRIGQTSANNICVEDTDFEVNKDFICKGKIISDSSIQGNSFKLKAYPSNNAMSATTVTLHGTSTDVMHIGINQNSGLPIRILSTCTYMSGDLDFYNNEHGIIINNAYAFRWTNGALYCGIDSKPLRLVGSAIYANGSPVATTSDMRVKKDISNLDGKYLNLIKRLEPKTFKYDDSIALSGRTHSGYIAQDLETAINEVGLTTTDVAAFVDLFGDNTQYAIRYEELIPLLHRWIKELDERINTLEKKGKE